MVIDFEAEDVVVVAPVKKKKVKAKTVRVGTELASAQVGANSIEAEDTLAMIKNALKSANPDTIESSSKKVKKVKKKEKLPKLEENTEEMT